jgi:hypothetical protein
MAWTGHQKTPVGACHASKSSARHLNFSIARPPHPRKPPNLLFVAVLAYPSGLLLSLVNILWGRFRRKQANPPRSAPLQ